MKQESEQPECLCAFCALKLDFELDAHLVDEIEKHNAVIFAGAGISTETTLSHPNSFYEELQSETNSETGTPFPQIVDQFQNRPNGRQQFIQLITKRFAYIDGFRQLRQIATGFHRELSTMPYFQTIITTNWDRYFEDECGANPFVYESDVPFFNVSDRPVLKIHGSIDNYASIVASTDDYVKCEERLRDGAMGAVLKQIFATRTIIFCGYSATDPDFLKIYNTIRHGLGAFARTHYLISPFLEEEDASRLRALNIIGIRTDATHFLATIKEHMVQKLCYAKDDTFDAVFLALMMANEVHEKFTSSYRPVDKPHLIYATVYQDGLIHALQRICDHKKTGKLSSLHYVDVQIDLYQDKIDEYLRKRNYWDVSYFIGYQTGLELFLALNRIDDDEDLPDLPLFFHPGIGHIDTYEDYETKVVNNPEVHKTALKQAKRAMEKYGLTGPDVIQHFPWG